MLDMKLEIYDDRRNRYRFRIVSSNGKCLARSSKSYSDREELHGVISTLFGPTSELKVYLTASGEHRWRATIAGAPVLISSEGYVNESHCNKMAHKVMEASIVDE